MNCPECEQTLVISAKHEYIIEYNEEQECYVKDEGDVCYICNLCDTILSVSEIAEILVTVDEL